MQAEIAILKRLPRRLDTLTYLIPEALSLRRGDLVLVPFRTKMLHGIVTRVSSGSRDKLKPVLQIVISQFVSDAYLQCMEGLARSLIQSLSTVVYSSVILPLHKQCPAGHSLWEVKRRQIMVRRHEVTFVGEIVRSATSHPRLNAQVTDLTQAAAIIDGLRQGNGQLLILVPHHHDAYALSSALGIPFFDTTLKPVSRAQLATGWRTGGQRELIATRLGSLLPAKDLQRAVIVHSASAEHVQYDRNPRYDAREVLAVRSAHLLSLEVLPRLNDLVTGEPTFWLPNELKTPVEVIDLKHERGKEFFLLTPTLLSMTREALQAGKNVLFSYNRKGVSRALECRDCGWISNKDEIEHSHCKLCQSPRLTQRGVGNQLVQKALTALFREIPILRSELGVVYHDPHTPHIVLATQHHFESVLDPFAPANIDLVAELRADLGLLDTRYTAMERLAQRLWRLRGIAWRAKAAFVAQSFDAPLMRRVFDEPERFLRDELELRQRFAYPPFRALYRVGGKFVRPSQEEIVALKQQSDSVIIERNPEL